MPAEKPSSYQPVPTPKPGKFTVSEMILFGNFFRQLIQSTSLKWWIIAAGIGGVFEVLHILWLAGVWLYWFGKSH
jgi:hypothetical protein